MVRIVLICCLVAFGISVFAQNSEVEIAEALYDEIFDTRPLDEEALLEARKLWERLADEGDPGSQFFMAVLYWAGLGGVEMDERRANSLMHEAAESDYLRAQFTLGLWYETGSGGVVDWELAVDWYRKAAEQGASVARERLFTAYSNGELGLPKDPEQARLWE